MEIKRRDKAVYVSGGWQAYVGAGELIAAVYDGTSLSSNVLTLYDTASGATTEGGVAAPTLATWTQDSDAGTTVPVRTYADGRVVATVGTASANTHLGVPFSRGLFVNKTGDTTNNLALKFLIRPLIRKSVNLSLGGAGGAGQTVKVFDGPGILKAARIKTSQEAAAAGTADLLFRDGTASGSLRTLWTGTNYVTAGPSTLFPVTTTGIDDAGSAVTTAATGAYTNDGIAFVDGLWLNVAQGHATAVTYEIDCLIEG